MGACERVSVQRGADVCRRTIGWGTRARVALVRWSESIVSGDVGCCEGVTSNENVVRGCSWNETVKSRSRNDVAL